MKDTYLIYKKNGHKYKNDIDKIMINLEKYGRAVYNNPKAARYLSRRLNSAKNDKIFFGNCKKIKTSLIVLKPGYEAKRKNKYLELIYNETME